MHIGLRRVRSAGRASGSIEITLPPELTPLEGIQCNILIRDGARPEIVLKPELAPAATVFARVWGRLRFLLQQAGEIGEFPISEVDVSLLQPATSSQVNGGGRRPTLVYAHALVVGQALILRWPMVTGEFAVRMPTSDLSDGVRKSLLGVIYPLASVAGHRLGLISEVASYFGHVVASLALPTVADAPGTDGLDGLPTSSDGRFEIAWSRQIWQESCGNYTSSLGVLTGQPNDVYAQEALQRIVSQFREWQEHPERRQTARIEWLAQIPDWFTGAPQSISTR